MENLTDDLISKVKVIAQGPNAELLRKLVEVLYEQAERLEEYDEEPFSPEDLAAIQEGEESIKRGEFISAWKIMKRNAVCELLRSIISPCKKAIGPVGSGYCKAVGRAS